MSSNGAYNKNSDVLKNLYKLKEIFTNIHKNTQQNHYNIDEAQNIFDSLTYLKNYFNQDKNKAIINGLISLVNLIIENKNNDLFDIIKDKYDRISNDINELITIFIRITTDLKNSPPTPQQPQQPPTPPTTTPPPLPTQQPTTQQSTNQQPQGTKNNCTYYNATPQRFIFPPCFLKSTKPDDPQFFDETNLNMITFELLIKLVDFMHDNVKDIDRIRKSDEIIFDMIEGKKIKNKKTGGSVNTINGSPNLSTENIFRILPSKI